MRIVVPLGGNARLKRGEPMTAEAQQTNVRITAAALADLARDHQVIVARGERHTGRRLCRPVRTDRRRIKVVPVEFGKRHQTVKIGEDARRSES